MTNADLHRLLASLLALPAETEWVEFKEAKTSFDLDKLGEYFSALSNEANLKGQRCGWLVFGVTDRLPRKIVGTQFKSDRAALDALKKQVADQTTGRLTFTEIHELAQPEGRVLMFEIPAALRGVPTAWKGHFYGRDGESIGALNLGELEVIRAQIIQQDWSAQLVPEASLADLDPAAIAFARTQFREKHPQQTTELDGWDDTTFLNKAKVCSAGRITRTALLLLGREEAIHYLSPAQARVTWVLSNEKNGDYHHFDAPLILASDRILAKIRNLTVRHLPSGTLFPHEITQYDPWVIRETLHNCIAHQDYTQGGRINVVERPDSLLFTNRGSFIPGTVEQMIRSNAPPEVYRNPFLAQAMVNLNMIDTIGSGIRKMFLKQRERSFPLPDFDLSRPDRVEVRLTGQILDENYTRQLLNSTDLDLADVMALDRVQKKKPIAEDDFKRLKTRGLIEGRRPNLFVSAKIAAATGDKATYIKNRAFDRAHYKDLVTAYLGKFGEASRADLDSLLLKKLSDALSDTQKKRFLSNLLQEMKMEGRIFADGTTRWARWRMTKPSENGGVSP